MTKPNKSSNSEEQSTYLSIGIIFFIAGLGMIVPEGTRATGLPFIVLGLTFLIISYQKPESKRKK